MAKETGWIKLHRKIQDNPNYFKEPFCRNMAWVDLLLLANHKENSERFRGIRIVTQRGQIAISTVELAKRWRWSRGKVLRYLDELEMDDQIEQQKNNVTTLISILNYSSYQSGDTANSTTDGQQTGTQTDSRRTADLRNDVNANTLQAPKNDKNEKKERNIGGRGGFDPPLAPPQNSFAVFKAPDGSLVKEMKLEFKPEDFNGLPESWLMKISDNIWSVKQFRVEPERISTLWDSFKHLEMHKKLYSNKDGVYSFFSNYCKKQTWTKPKAQAVSKPSKQSGKRVGVEFINDFTQCRMNDGSVVDLDQNQKDLAKFNSISPSSITR